MVGLGRERGRSLRGPSFVAEDLPEDGLIELIREADIAPLVMLSALWT